jgi:Spy/CpxP family protein refolding chaperone
MRPSLRPVATLGLAVLVLSWSTTMGLARQATSTTGTATQAAKPTPSAQQSTTQAQGQGAGRTAPPSNQFQGGRGPGGPGRDDGPKWWQDDAIKKEIGLRDDQIRQIDGIYQRRVKEMAPFAEEYEKQRDAFAAMLRDHTADVAAAQLQISKMQGALTKLDESRWLMVYRMYKVLEPAQYTKLQAYWEKQQAEWRARGRGRGGY